MGFGNFLNKLAGGTLTHDDQQQTVDLTAQQAAPIVATPSTTPMPDPLPAAQPTQDTPTSQPTPVQDAQFIASSGPVPQPTDSIQTTDTMPPQSTSLSQPTDQSATPADQPSAILTGDTNSPVLQSAKLSTEPAILATDTPVVQADTTAVAPIPGSTPLADLRATAYNALDTLTIPVTDTAEITHTRKRYEDAVVALGNSHGTAAFTILFDLLLTHIEAELYKFPAFQEMGGQPSTLAVTTTAMDTLVTATPIGKDICTPNHLEILRQLVEAIKLAEPVANDHLTSAYKTLSA